MAHSKSPVSPRSLFGSNKGGSKVKGMNKYLNLSNQNESATKKQNLETRKNFGSKQFTNTPESSKILNSSQNNNFKYIKASFDDKSHGPFSEKYQIVEKEANNDSVNEITENSEMLNNNEELKLDTQNTNNTQVTFT